MLIALNPAALVVNLANLVPGALIIVDESAFTAQRLKRASLDTNPLEDDTLEKFDVCRVDISHLTLEAVKPFGLGAKDAMR